MAAEACDGKCATGIKPNKDGTDANISQKRDTLLTNCPRSWRLLPKS
jgi:hypothetical protein